VQEKLRIFIDPTDNLTIYLSPIRFVVGLDEKDVRNPEMTKFVIDELRGALIPKLEADGFEVVHSDPV
jgi:hypothetical protein